jgi:CheY-like chemotaxis protein
MTVTMEKVAGSDGKKAGLCVLVVDDNADCADSMAMVLRLYGHEVEVARNGPSALKAAAAHRPDVILLDIGLPGMDGWQVAEHIKGNLDGKRPLVVVVSGFGQPADLRHSADSGVDLHMVKPVDPGELEEMLRRFQGVISG